MALSRWTSALWTIAAIVAVLWPSRFIGPLDGAPLDGGADAIVLGLILPALWWLSRERFRSSWSRAAIVALLGWKAVTGLVFEQQGLCLTTSAAAPISGTAMTMRIDEPRGFLRSWDVRADLWSDEPRCTAIVTRPLIAPADFPAWFVNMTDQLIGRRDFTMRFSGFVTTDAGPVRFDESLAVTSEQMHFDPQIGSASLWRQPLVTVGEPGALDRLFAPWAWLVAPLLCLALISRLALDAASRLQGGMAFWAAVTIATLAAMLLGLPAAGDWQRAAGAITFGAVVVRARASVRNVRGAFLLVGLPWLAFFAVRSFGQIGRFSLYSTDDWLAFQVAGYRIFMNGYWLEAGSLTFDYQPLYRWITGALHLVFGDSSVGEVYWDAACLLIGALLAFQIVRATAGFRAGIAAAAATLATFTLGTPWHFFGRGLSEISAAGFAFLAMWFLLRSRLGAQRWVVAATAMAVLMFFARLNHLLWVAFLPAMLLPLRTSIEWRSVVHALRFVKPSAIAIYASGFAGALGLFMARTWYYTGDFSLFHGTSLRHNDTGLRLWTLFDAAVWAKVWHSLQSFAWMNEPPRPDPRAVIMVIGFLIAAAALAQLPVARRLPAALVITAAGSLLGAFFAHAHGYPGRFSIHAVPLASAMTMIVASRALPR
jgi:hypothetical protein